MPLRNTPGIHTPIIVPMIVPTPPNTLVPPSAAAVIASSGSLCVAADRRGVEAGEREHAAEPRQRSGEGVDLEQVAVDVDADPPCRLGVGADGVGVSTEHGEVEQDGGDDDHAEGDEHEVGNAADAPVAEGVERAVGDVDAVGDDLRRRNSPSASSPRVTMSGGTLR